MTAVTTEARLSFELPPELEASAPAELRGLARDGVRMMVADRSTGGISHSTFARLGDYLVPGDVVVVNTSRTIPAAVDALASTGERVVVHFSTEIRPGIWVVEPRRAVGKQSTQREGAAPPPRLGLIGGSLELLERYRHSPRLWVARVSLGEPVIEWLGAHGRPIRYGYVGDDFPLDVSQNVYADQPGSAEMASAGRPFSAELIRRLVAAGVEFAPVVLHTGVASLEDDELPYPERVKVPSSTARRVNDARADGARVVAVGTTVVRALESAADDDDTVHGFEGWTDLVITPARGVRVVDAMITGWHPPGASHLLMLEAIAGRALLESAYREALAGRYLWHEFGDSLLILR